MGTTAKDVDQRIDEIIELDRKLHEGIVHDLDLPKFSRVNLKRCESPEGFDHALNSWTLSDWFTATMGELGEAANIAKKLNRYRDGIRGNKESKADLQAKLGSEIADTFIYLDLLCQSAGLDLSTIVVSTFNAKSDSLGCDIKYDPAD